MSTYNTLQKNLVWHFKKSVILYCISRHFNDCHVLSSKIDIYNRRFVKGTTFFVAQFNSHMLNENAFLSIVNTLPPKWKYSPNWKPTHQHWIPLPKPFFPKIPPLKRSLVFVKIPPLKTLKIPPHFVSKPFVPISFPNLWFPCCSHLRIHPQNGFPSLSRSQSGVSIGSNPNPNKLSNLFYQWNHNWLERFVLKRLFHDLRSPSRRPKVRVFHFYFYWFFIFVFHFVWKSWCFDYI